MRRILTIWWLLICEAIIGLPFAGCNHVSTTAERAHSFQPYSALIIDGEPSRTFLDERFGILIGGVDRAKISRAPDGRVMSVALEAKNIGFGSATAIDRRGYFLTAAHCVAKTPVFIFYGKDKEHPHFEKARIVWSGQPAKLGEDLAILKISSTLDAAFEWDEETHQEEVVLTEGLNSSPDKQFDFDFGYLAGKITKIVPHSDGVHPSKIIYHSSPTHGGDSGGPLVDTKGRLIGIVTEGGMVRFGPFSAVLAIAERPDPSWLRAVLDDDFAHHSSDTADSP